MTRVSVLDRQAIKWSNGQWSQSIHCSTWPLVDRKLRRVKQMLINNGYSNSDFDMITHDMIDKYVTTPHTTQRTTRGTPDTISICYRNTLTPAWKKYEKVIRDIIRKNVTPVQPEHIIRLKVNYKTPRTSSRIMQKSHQSTTTLQQTNVVYRFKCSTGDCATRNLYYIGHTTTSLSRRLT